MRVWSAGLAAALAAGGVHAAGGSLLLRTLKSGQNSPVEKPLRQVARTPAEWSALWARQSAGAQGKTAPPKLDFGREMGAAVFLGTRPTGGYGVEIRGAREEKGRLVVTVVERKPPPAAMTIEVLTSPFQYAVLRKSALPVEWRLVSDGAKPKPATPRTPPAAGAR